MLWAEFFYYDESSPSCLRWKLNRYAGDQYQILKAAKDSVAGSLSVRDNYWRVWLNGKSYLAHRVVMELSTGLPCDLQVDHINGDRSANRLENLRYVTGAYNARNAKMQTSNTSGVTGVKLTNTHKGRYWNWMASVETPHGRKTKAFSINVYGDDEAFRLACEWRSKMIEQLNAEGAGYTERHGKEVE